MNIPRLVSIMLVVCAATAGSSAENAATPAGQAVDFVRDIQPIFAERCFHCHGEDVQEGQLRMDARAAVMRGGVSGPLFEKGSSKRSLLLERLTTKDTDARMPLDEEPLSEAEIRQIRRWLEQGAQWPDGVGAQVDFETHWAYVPPQRAALPKVTASQWPHAPIDYFVLAGLEREGLTPSAPADRARLLRRLYLDLLGIPPSPAEVESFVHDRSPDAYEKRVDQALGSPRFGERWARDWLDLARYADSNGYQADQYRNVWPYRDWVISSMNADMPFDQFTIEQLAGDLLPNATVDQKIASGFHRLTTCNVEAGVDPEENRVNQIIDRVNTTGTVWLGTTVECMQCHSHKYDPFSQKEYYQLFAYFNNTPLEVEGNGVTYNFVGPKMALPLTEEQQAARAQIQRQLDGCQEELKSRVAERSKQQPAWERAVAASLGQQPQYHVLTLDRVESTGGSSHKLMADQSVLFGPETPDRDTYRLTASTDVKNITGFRLEALTDPSLPGNGPGRHQRPNFVLNEFTVSVGGKPVTLTGATADFSQSGWPVTGAVDGDLESGWGINPQFGQPHHATFFTAQPIGHGDGDGDGETTTLQFELVHNYGGCRAIGRVRLSAMTGRASESDLPANVRDALAVAQDQRTKKQQQVIGDYFVGRNPDVKRLRDEIAALEKQLAAIQPITSLVMVERDEPRMTTVFKRGNFLNKGEAVTAGTPATLHEIDPELPANRIGFAGWLMDRRNPLTARVVVNRWWAQFFGQGIVATLEDFGTQGEPPTHPELLDWLACEFMDSGWSRKHVHRQIVLSATYRQSSRVTPELVQQDPYNKWLARGPRFRLSAEIIRDNALAAAGLLTNEIGGPPVYPPQPAGVWRHVGRNEPKYATSQGTDRFRRGIYTIWRRSAPYPAFTNFDAPDRASCVVKRPRTNTPLQALTLMNDPAYIEMAVALAERILSDHSDMSDEQRAAYGFRLCVARSPQPHETAHLLQVYQREYARLVEDPKAVETLLGKHPTNRLEPAKLAAWFYVANVLLNLDETITKG